MMMCQKMHHKIPFMVHDTIPRWHILGMFGNVVLNQPSAVLFICCKHKNYPVPKRSTQNWNKHELNRIEKLGAEISHQGPHRYSSIVSNSGLQNPSHLEVRSSLRSWKSLTRPITTAVFSSRSNSAFNCEISHPISYFNRSCFLILIRLTI